MVLALGDRNQRTQPQIIAEGSTMYSPIAMITAAV